MHLMEHLPEAVYHDEPHVLVFQSGIEAALDQLLHARDELMNQILPCTASWGLDLFEADYDILPEAGIGNVQRLARWRAKRRGRGTSTLEVIRGTAQSFFKRPVQVVEYPNEYRFIIVAPVEDDETLDWRGLSEALWGIKPAHLGHALHVELAVVFDGRSRFWVRSLDCRTGINVFGMELFCFDGMHTFNGSKIFTSQFTRGLKSPRFALKAWAGIQVRLPWRTETIAFVRGGGQFELPVLELHWASNVFGMHTIHFDGSCVFDGSQIFTSLFKSGPHLVAAEIRQRRQALPRQTTKIAVGARHSGGGGGRAVMKLTAQEKHSLTGGVPEIGFQADLCANSGFSGKAEVSCKQALMKTLRALRFETHGVRMIGQALSTRTLQLHARAQVGQETKATLTQDSMWNMDGKYRMDGVRKMNASITQEKL